MVVELTLRLLNGSCVTSVLMFAGSITIGGKCPGPFKDFCRYKTTSNCLRVTLVNEKSWIIRYQPVLIWSFSMNESHDGKDQS